MAIGYRRAAISSDAAQGFGVVVNPSKSSEVTLTDADRVIVLAESWRAQERGATNCRSEREKRDGPS